MSFYDRKYISRSSAIANVVLRDLSACTWNISQWSMFYSACGKRVVLLDYRKRYTSVTNCRYCEIITNRYVVLRSNVRTCHKLLFFFKNAISFYLQFFIISYWKYNCNSPLNRYFYYHVYLNFNIIIILFFFSQRDINLIINLSSFFH